MQSPPLSGGKMETSVMPPSEGEKSSDRDENAIKKAFHTAKVEKVRNLQMYVCYQP